MKNILLVLVLMISICIIKLNAQHVEWQGIQSPNASSLGTYGSVPVNYFTGTPNISIPIYNLKSDNLEIPIILSYHPANVKPNHHPGWVWLGWNLQSYGVITRVMNFLVDESDEATGSWKPYFKDGANKLNDPNWNSQEKIKEYFSDSVSYDVQADEFYFNFLNYSGKFIWTHEGWKVVSDSNIKIIAGDNDQEDFIYDVGTKLNNQYDYVNFVAPDQSRAFKHFTLITDDGIQFVFGGEDAIEYTEMYDSEIDGLVATSWYLKKIIDLNNNEIDFEYHRNYPICQLSYFSTTYLGQCNYDWSFGHSFSTFSNIRTSQHGGYTIFPVYLSKIITRNQTVEFKTSFSKELRYTDSYLKYSNDRDINTAYDLYWLAGDTDKLRWEQLDEIIIRDLNNNVVKNYGFNYSSDKNVRLTLNSLVEKSASNSPNMIYTFFYNNIDQLPEYGGDKTDHWGFYNNRSVDGISWSQLYSIKETNKNVISTGLLNKIEYPTGGSTQFEWQVNDYSNVVSTSRDNLDNETGYAGGARIRKINSYDKDEILVNEKTYLYLSDYKGSSDGLKSSGVLSGKPQYYFSVNNRPCAYTDTNSGCENISYTTGSISSLVNYSYNAFSSHIGYS